MDQQPIPAVDTVIPILIVTPEPVIQLGGTGPSTAAGDDHVRKMQSFMNFFPPEFDDTPLTNYSPEVEREDPSYYGY